MLELVICLLITVFYVATLYIWSSELNRDHPTTIKRRFVSVSVIMVLAPVIVYIMCHGRSDASLWELLGLRYSGLLRAFYLPLFLTMLLFLGPIAVQVSNGAWKTYIRFSYWKESFQDLIWIRNHVMAPLSEEFAFRACMLPILQLTFSRTTAVFITPLFFGIAHLHHMIERIRSGFDKRTAIIVSSFQFVYTTIFGIYSAFLFVRTGHFMAPFIAHAFCNHMGFPDIQELMSQPEHKRHIYYGLYVAGLVSFLLLLPTFTRPDWYENRLYV